MEARIQSVRNEVLQHTSQIQEIPDRHTPEKAAIKLWHITDHAFQFKDGKM